MVVYHSCGLHMSINHGASHKFKTPIFQIPADPVGKRGGSRSFAVVLYLIPNWNTIGKTPEIRSETAKLLLDFQKCIWQYPSLAT